MALLLTLSINFLYYKHIVEHDFDVVYLSETFLNSFFQNDDYDRLKMVGYILIR